MSTSSSSHSFSPPSYVPSFSSYSSSSSSSSSTSTSFSNASAFSTSSSSSSTSASPSSTSSFLAEAHKSALSELKSMFRNSDQLSRLNHYQLEIERKKRTLDSQLSSAVRTQIDETRLGLEFLVQSSQSIVHIRQNFRNIDQYCRDCKSLLKEYSHIQRVNTARKNLDATTRLLDKFKSIGEKCDELMAQLADDRMIKDVYKSLRLLMKLRESAFDSQLSVSEGFTDRIKESFQRLVKCAEEVEEIIWQNIADCKLMLKDDPLGLIRTLEVIEMEDRAKRKIFSGLQQFQAPKGTSKQQQDEKPYQSMHDKCLHALETSIGDTFKHLHQDEDEANKEERLKEKAAKEKAKNAAKLRAKLDRAGESDEESEKKEEEEEEEEDEEKSFGDDNSVSDYVCKVLEDMTDQIESLPGFLSELVPIFPPSYALVPFYEDRYKHWLRVTLHFHANDSTKLSKKALLKTVVWIDWYIDHFSNHQAWFTKEDIKDLDRLTKDLMQNFCHATEDTIMTLVDNILKHDSSAVAEPDPDGYYTTSAPSDLFYTINQQMDIVLNSFGLKGKALYYICKMLCDVFTYYQNKQLNWLKHVEMMEEELYFGPEKVTKPDTYFCAVINNCQQSQENMDELKERCLERMVLQAHGSKSRKEKSSAAATAGSIAGGGKSDVFAANRASLKDLSQELEDAFEECGEGFVSLATEAVDILVLMIVTTLQTVFAGINSSTWLKDKSSNKDLITTLSDYFSSYKSWISREAYFSLIVKNSLRALVAEYLRKFTEMKPTLNEDVFERLRTDKKLFEEFFLNYSDLLPSSTITSELELILLVETLIQEDPDLMSVHYAKVKLSFGLAGCCEAMEGLMAMRSDLNRSQRKDVVEAFNAYIKAEREGAARAAAGEGGVGERGEEGENGGERDGGGAGGAERGGGAASMVADSAKKKVKKDEASEGGFWSRLMSGNQESKPSKPTKPKPQRRGRDEEETVNLKNFLDD